MPSSCFTVMQDRLVRRVLQSTCLVSWNLRRHHHITRHEAFYLYLLRTTEAHTDVRSEREGGGLTFLASHSCVGRGLLTPIRLSSLGSVEKENTAQRKVHFVKHAALINYCKPALITSGKSTLTVPRAVNLCFVYARCTPASTRNKDVGRDDQWRDTNQRNIRGASILTSCFNYTGMSGAISSSCRKKLFGIQSAITVQLRTHNSWASGTVLLVRVGGADKERAIVFLVPQRASSVQLQRRPDARHLLSNSLCCLLGNFVPSLQVITQTHKRCFSYISL